MKLSLLVFPLLALPAANAATCKNCGGADKTSAKRVKMPNKSVFTRLAGIELIEIFEITHQIDHEVCAQQCDAHFECAAFEYLLPNKLCVLASEYYRISDDLTKGAFEKVVFVKVRGKFTKAFPKDKETCLDKAEYEDYVNNEVDKWLNPSPKKTTSYEGNNVTPTEQADTTDDSHSTSEVQYSATGSGTVESATPTSTYENEDQEAAHSTYDPSTTLRKDEGETPSVAATTTSPTTPAETSLPNYSTTVGSVEVEESVATSVPTYGQSSETPETTPQGAEGGETTLEPTTTRRGEESTRGDSLTTDKVIIFEGRISSVKYSKYVRGSGGQVQLSLTAADKWTLFKSGDKVEIKLSATGSFLGADEKTGKVFLTDDSQKWEIERNIDGTVSFSVNSQWLSATSDDRLVVAPKAMRFKSEMFILE